MSILNRRGFVVFTSSLMLLITLLTSARIDLTRPDIFFYATRLSPLWYLMTFLMLAAVMKANDGFIKIFTSILLIYLVYGVPAYMLANPRLNDQYPFIAEPLYIQLHGHLGDMHYLLQSPGLGVFFSQLAMVIGIDLRYLDGIRMLSDFFAYMNPLILAISISAVSRSLSRTEKWILTVPFMLAMSLAYPIDIFHRQSFSLSYLFLYFYGLTKRDPIILSLSSIAMVLSHPGTPLFTFISLLLAIALVHALKDFMKLNSRESKYIGTTVIGLILLTTCWFIFHMITTQSILDSVVRAFKGFVDELLGGEARLMMVDMFAMGTTSEFRNIVLIPRLIILGLYLVIFWLMTFIVLRNTKATPALKLLALIHIGYLPQVIPFIYWGTLNIRAMLFVLYSSIPLIPLYFEVLNQTMPKEKGDKNILDFIFNHIIRLVPILKKALYALAVLSIVLSPILTYSTIPFLHSSIAEISAQQFLECNYDGVSPKQETPIIVTEYPTWIFNVVCNNGETKLSSFVVNSSAIIELLLNGKKQGFLIVGRLIARESFYAPTGLLYGSGTESQREFIARINDYGLKHMNRVYDSSNEATGPLGMVVLFLK